jgi:hypothetical protein
MERDGFSAGAAGETARIRRGAERDARAAAVSQAAGALSIET